MSGCRVTNQRMYLCNNVTANYNQQSKVKQATNCVVGFNHTSVTVCSHHRAVIYKSDENEKQVIKGIRSELLINVTMLLLHTPDATRAFSTSCKYTRHKNTLEHE